MNIDPPADAHPLAPISNSLTENVECLVRLASIVRHQAMMESGQTRPQHLEKIEAIKADLDGCARLIRHWQKAPAA
jgi:hypothetical protein